MTILSVCKLVAPHIGISVPSEVFSGTSRTQIELQSLANEMLKRIARHYDWQLFKTIATLTGDGTQVDFDLPDDYERMLVKARLWSSSEPTTPYVQIADADQWLGLDVQDFDTIVDRYAIFGGQIHVSPAIASAETVKFFYQSKLIVEPTGGGANITEFMNDTDSTRLNEQTLKLGMIWQWKAYKGLPYAEDMANYEDSLAIDVAKDRGPREIVVGRPRMNGDYEYAWPRSIVPT